MPGSALIRALAARLSAPDPVGSRMGYRAAAWGGAMARGAEARSQRRLGLSDGKRLLDAEHRGRKAGMAAGDRAAGAAHRYGPLAVAAGVGGLSAAEMKQRRDAAKAGAEKRRARDGDPVEKTVGADDLAKAWQRRLPAVLAAIHAAHAMRAAGGHEPAMLDSTAVTRLVGRVARIARERAGSGAIPQPPKQGRPFPDARPGKEDADPHAGKKPPRGADTEGDEAEAPRKKGKAGKAPPFTKAMTAAGEILAKHAPREIRSAYADLSTAERAAFLEANAPIVTALRELDDQVRVTPIAERPALVKAWVQKLEPKDRELVKFWGLAARGVMAAAPMAGRLAGATARGIGMLGPKLSRLFGVGRPAAAAAAERQAGAAVRAGTHIPPIPGAAGAATPSLGYRAARAGRTAMGYGARATRGLGRHVYANRGGYGITAGYEVGRRFGAEE